MLDINNFECTTSGMQSMQKGPPSPYLWTDDLGLRGVKPPRKPRISHPELRSHTGRECYQCLEKKDMDRASSSSKSSSVRDAEKLVIWNGLVTKSGPTSNQGSSTDLQDECLLVLCNHGAERGVNFMDRQDLAHGASDLPSDVAEERTDLRLHTVTTNLSHTHTHTHTHIHISDTGL